MEMFLKLWNQLQGQSSGGEGVATGNDIKDRLAFHGLRIRISIGRRSAAFKSFTCHCRSHAIDDGVGQ